jgi:hypothetical protein
MNTLSKEKLIFNFYLWQELETRILFLIAETQTLDKISFLTWHIIWAKAHKEIQEEVIKTGRFEVISDVLLEM